MSFILNLSVQWNESYFWLEQSLLPYPMGYARFSWQHLLTLGILLVLGILLYRLFCRLSPGGQRRFLQVIAVMMPVMEAGKLLLLAIEGVFDLSYLPFFLCSLGIYVFPIIAFAKYGRVVYLTSVVCLLVLVPSSLAALLFPDWIGDYPAISFMSLYSYLWHFLLILFPLCTWRADYMEVHKSSSLVAFLALFAMLPFILILDNTLGQNYWFIEKPEVNNPFYGIYNFGGQALYMGVLFTTGAVLIFLSWGVFYALQKRKNRIKAAREAAGTTENETVSEPLSETVSETVSEENNK